ncbi:MAG: hypothetical protein LQ342_003399 [Letrouitia transgressa]|nr:MAG: hypothetical protein LQ342_003399 [Letrouitia transgressa]
MITEIVTFQLQASADLGDINSPTTQAIRSSLSVVLADSKAPSAYYGQFLKRPDTAILFVNWPSNNEHERFKSSPSYETHFKHMAAVIDMQKPISVLNVPFAPSEDPSAALGLHDKVGVTEVIFLYCGAGFAKSEITSAAEKIRPVMGRSGAQAMVGGWAAETQLAIPEAGENEKGEVYVNVGGWADAEAYERSQESKKIQQSIHDLLETKDIRYSEFNLVKFFPI